MLHLAGSFPEDRIMRCNMWEDFRKTECAAAQFRPLFCTSGKGAALCKAIPGVADNILGSAGGLLPYRNHKGILFKIKCRLNEDIQTALPATKSGETNH